MFQVGVNAKTFRHLFDSHMPFQVEDYSRLHLGTLLLMWPIHVSISSITLIPPLHVFIRFIVVDPSQYCSPGALHLERALIRWLADLIGFPSSAGGDLTSGGSIATLCAVVSARESHKIRCRDVETTVVYLSTQTHFCVRKALHIAGLGNCIVRFVDVDSQFRMKPESLSSLIVSDLKEGLKPWLIVASAGTTCVGSVDRLNPIADVASDHGLWLHVDAAYGGCFLLTDYGKELMQGIERADTVVIDPHKGLIRSIISILFGLLSPSSNLIVLF